MPQQLASIMCEYAEHEATTFTAATAKWEPTVFTRDAKDNVRAHPLREPTEDGAVARVQAIVAEVEASAAGLLLWMHTRAGGESLLVAAGDGSSDCARAARVARYPEAPPGLGAWRAAEGDDDAAVALALVHSGFEAPPRRRSSPRP